MKKLLHLGSTPALSFLGRFVAATGLCAILTHAQAASPIAWEVLDAATWDCDAINVSVYPNQSAAGSITFELEASPNVTWWKGLAYIASGKLQDEAWTQAGSQSRDSLTVTTSQIQPSDQIELKKAKIFGVHTGMYLLTDPTRFPDASKVVFAWTQDSCQYQAFHLRQASGPSHMRPGSSSAVQLEITNTGNTTWTGYSHYIVTAGGVNQAFNIQPFFPLAAVVQPSSTLLVTVPITAPKQRGIYTLPFQVWQRGSNAIYGNDVRASGTPMTIEVSDYPGQVAAPSSPAPTRVPGLVGKTQVDAENDLRKAGLTPGHVNHQGDPNTTIADRIVWSQSHSAGSKISEGSSIDFDTMDAPPASPSGVAGVDVYNCSKKLVSVWVYESFDWKHIADLAPQWNDGLCPATGTPVDVSFSQQGVVAIAAVDRSLIGCKSGHPSESVCVRRGGALMSDPNGPRITMGVN